MTALCFFFATSIQQGSTCTQSVWSSEALWSNVVNNSHSHQSGPLGLQSSMIWWIRRCRCHVLAWSRIQQTGVLTPASTNGCFLIQIHGSTYALRETADETMDPFFFFSILAYWLIQPSHHFPCGRYWLLPLRRLLPRSPGTAD